MKLAVGKVVMSISRGPLPLASNNCRASAGKQVPLAEKFELVYIPAMAIQDIIERAGGVYEVAGALNIRRQAVEQWIAADRIPAERVLAIARLAQVRPSELRPDLYPPGMVA